MKKSNRFSLLSVVSLLSCGAICSICCTLILLDLLTGLSKAKIQGRLISDTLCPHYTSAGICCKSCPCGEQFSGGLCSSL